jgi:30S ribosomal protein S5, cyanelle
LTKNDTVPYPIALKYKACVVKLLPASEGTGLKAGSSIRSVLELAGYSNILSKMVGSNNKLNNALATIRALSAYKHADYFSSLKGGKTELALDENNHSEGERTVEDVNTKSTSKKPSSKTSTKVVKEELSSEEITMKKAPAKKVAPKKTAKKED